MNKATERKVQLNLVHRMMVIVKAMEEVTEAKILEKLKKLEEEFK